MSGVVDRSPRPGDVSPPLETAESSGDADPSAAGEISAVRGGDARGATGGGTSSFFLGKKAALMSPMPTKNSSANAVRRQ